MSNKLKRNYIRLVENPEAEEIKLETYLTPHFIPLDVLYESVDIMAELEKAENGEVELSFKEQLDKLIDVVVKIYGKQFTAKDIRNRLHAPDALETLQKQVQFIANGQQDEETKSLFRASAKQIKKEDLTYNGMLKNLDKVVKIWWKMVHQQTKFLKCHFIIYFKF